MAFFKNMNNQQVSGYGIIQGATSSVASDSWGSCNLLDAKSYGLLSEDITSIHNNMSPVTAVYAWRRQA